MMKRDPASGSQTSSIVRFQLNEAKALLALTEKRMFCSLFKRRTWMARLSGKVELITGATWLKSTWEEKAGRTSRPALSR